MPQHMGKVSAILQGLPAPCRKNLLLLIVPGLDWRKEQIACLRTWRQQGHILAGHGWLHQASGPRNLYHRIHGALISRNAAEHLSLSEPEIEDMIRRNFQWFADKDLGAPDYYVPPAWAMGRISRRRLRQLPYRFYETTSGLYDCRLNRFTCLPLTGYEADNFFREHSLRLWNQLNIIACSSRRPVRISIHPNDFSLRLAQSLRRHLKAVNQTVHYHALATDT